jgi:DNA invertase Pin-like site-specific DNA recombinase
MIGAMTHFERELMLERQREGIARAKADGNYKGRAPTARAKIDRIRALRSEGIGATEIARRLGTGKSSVSQPAVGLVSREINLRAHRAIAGPGGSMHKTGGTVCSDAMQDGHAYRD